MNTKWLIVFGSASCLILAGICIHLMRRTESKPAVQPIPSIRPPTHRRENISQVFLENVKNMDGSQETTNLKPPSPMIYQLPEYPENVRHAKLSGWVTLRITVSISGKVTDVALSKSLHPIMDDLAISTV